MKKFQHCSNYLDQTSVKNTEKIFKAYSLRLYEIMDRLEE